MFCVVLLVAASLRKMLKQFQFSFATVAPTITPRRGNVFFFPTLTVRRCSELSDVRADTFKTVVNSIFLCLSMFSVSIQAAEVERQLSTQVHSLRDDFREKSMSTSQHMTRLETLQAEVSRRRCLFSFIHHFILGADDWIGLSTVHTAWAPHQKRDTRTKKKEMEQRQKSAAVCRHWYSAWSRSTWDDSSSRGKGSETV